jgi:hypothetical protein
MLRVANKPILLSVVKLSVAIQNVVTPQNTLAYFAPAVKYEGEKIYEIDPRAQCYKTFYGCRLRLFIIS